MVNQGVLGMLERLKQTLEIIKSMTTRELEEALEKSTELKDGEKITVSGWAWYTYAVKKELQNRKKY